MAVTIFDVENGSVCAKRKIRPGDELVSINGNEIGDVLDYRFYGEGKKLKLVFRSGSGRVRRVTARNVEDPDELGLRFETYLMDRHRSCRNHCVFCFIDQLPKGLRPSLYFKDDDARLSFLFGNYITLTNLSEHDVERIIRMHISPINASVHTMDPELRVKMMRNPHAGEALSHLRRFSDAGIAINAQLVLCPGLNDGEALTSSLRELAALSGVRSIAAVPVGITKFREGLYPLRKFDAAGAADVIDRIDVFNAELAASGKEKLAYPSDEFFLLAGREIPDYFYYGDFPQLENGVGTCAATEYDFMAALAEAEGDDAPRRFSIVTGTAACSLLNKLSAAFSEKFPASRITVYGLENRFFGPDVTVAGLLTGRDIAEQLQERGFSDPALLLPSVMFKSAEEPVFLDDYTKEELETALHTSVTVADCDGEGMFRLFERMR